MTSALQRRPYALEIAGIVVNLPDVQLGERDGGPFVPAKELTRFRRAAARRAVEELVETPAVLRLLRKTAGLTGAELAHLLGVTEQAVSRWENGHAPPSAATWFVVRALAREALAGRSGARDELQARLRSASSGAGGDVF